VFSKPSVNANLANEFDDYEPAYIRYLEESVEDERNHAALLRWVEQFSPVTGQRALDVGCGSGKLVRFLRRAGVEACGLEPSTPLFSHFLAKDAFFVRQSLEEYVMNMPAEKFAVVFACDVIEHVERPDLFLRDLSALLQPGGTLFVSTPDVGSAVARISGRKWHFYNKYHVSLLSRATVGAAAAHHGLNEVGYAHLPRLRSVGYILQYIADFVGGPNRTRVPDRLHRLVIPVNVFDTMSLAFQKTRPLP
jgi:2-polyprenyl-3-methyl-5-hydroxy-6-metoxy-1,4-benzoquinol methylase